MFREGVHGPTAELRPQATGAQVRSTCESLDQAGVQGAYTAHVMLGVQLPSQLRISEVAMRSLANAQ